MNPSLETILDDVRNLTEDEQAYAAEILAALVDQSKRATQLSPKEIAGIEAARAEARRGLYADVEVEAFYHRIGL